MFCIHPSIVVLVVEVTFVLPDPIRLGLEGSGNTSHAVAASKTWKVAPLAAAAAAINESRAKMESMMVEGSVVHTSNQQTTNPWQKLLILDSMALGVVSPSGIVPCRRQLRAGVV